MEVTLEQSLASAIRFIQDNAAEGTKPYFDEVPAQFEVPSIYFQIPVTSGRKATLSTYCTTVTLNCWFMEGVDWDAQMKAADMRDCIMLNNCSIPIINVDGTQTGRTMRVGAPDTRKIDEGIVQLAFSFDIYFAPQKDTEKMQNFYTAWQSVVQRLSG